MPANAGIQGKRHSQADMDPGIRRDDGGISLNSGIGSLLNNSAQQTSLPFIKGDNKPAQQTSLPLYQRGIEGDSSL